MRQKDAVQASCELLLMNVCRRYCYEQHLIDHMHCVHSTWALEQWVKNLHDAKQGFITLFGLVVQARS